MNEKKGKWSPSNYKAGLFRPFNMGNIKPYKRSFYYTVAAGH